MGKFVYKHELAEELGSVKEKLNQVEERERIVKAMIEHHADIELYDKAIEYIEAQPFAVNFNGDVIIENLFCYRVDDLGFWFSFNYIGHEDRQIYNVQRKYLELKEV